MLQKTTKSPTNDTTTPYNTASGANFRKILQQLENYATKKNYPALVRTGNKGYAFTQQYAAFVREALLSPLTPKQLEIMLVISIANTNDKKTTDRLIKFVAKNKDENSEYTRALTQAMKLAVIRYGHSNYRHHIMSLFNKSGFNDFYIKKIISYADSKKSILFDSITRIPDGEYLKQALHIEARERLLKSSPENYYKPYIPSQKRNLV